MYLGYMIGGCELKIDVANMEGIIKWKAPTNCTKVRSFIGGKQYLWKFVALFSIVVAPLHTITLGG
jgi:hypothetical protein